MIDLQEFDKLKSKVENTRREVDRAEGALDEIKKRIKEEFGCETLAEAGKLEKKITDRIQSSK
ncbi:MAG: hypothetical protein V1920_00745 [Bacillota bacterium]